MLMDNEYFMNIYVYKKIVADPAMCYNKNPPITPGYSFYLFH